ncbi:MAG: murein hydrolase activator EnvC family protein [Gaiella sp.]
MRRAFVFSFLITLFVLVSPAAGHAWSWPANGAVLRPYQVGDDPYTGGQHRGIDVAVESGAPVTSVRAGVVTFAGTVPTHGKTVTVTTDDGYAISITHLGGLSVAKGDVVEEGRPIGVAGASGEAEHGRPYIHLGIRRAGVENSYLDPLSVLPAIAVATPEPAPPAAPEPAPAPASPPVVEPPQASPAPPTPAGPPPAREPAPTASAPAPPAPAPTQPAPPAAAEPAPAPEVVAAAASPSSAPGATLPATTTPVTKPEQPGPTTRSTGSSGGHASVDARVATGSTSSTPARGPSTAAPPEIVATGSYSLRPATNGAGRSIASPDRPGELSVHSGAVGVKPAGPHPVGVTFALKTSPAIAAAEGAVGPSTHVATARGASAGSEWPLDPRRLLPAFVVGSALFGLIKMRRAVFDAVRVAASSRLARER